MSNNCDEEDRYAIKPLKDIALSENEDSDYSSNQIEFDLNDPLGYPKNLYPPFSFNFRHYKGLESVEGVEERIFLKRGGTLIIPVSKERPDIIQFACDFMSDIFYGYTHNTSELPYCSSHEYASYSDYPYPLKYSSGVGRCLKYNSSEHLILWGVLWDIKRKQKYDKNYLETYYADYEWGMENTRKSILAILDSSEFQQFPKYDENSFKILPLDECNGFVIAFGARIGEGAIVVVPANYEEANLFENLNTETEMPGWERVERFYSKFHNRPLDKFFKFFLPAMPVTGEPVTAQVPDDVTSNQLSRGISIEIVKPIKNKFKVKINYPLQGKIEETNHYKSVTKLQVVRFLLIYSAWEKGFDFVFKNKKEVKIIKNDSTDIKVKAFGSNNEDSKAYSQGIRRALEALIQPEVNIDLCLEKTTGGQFGRYESDTVFSQVKIKNIKCKLSTEIKAENLKLPERLHSDEDIDFIMDAMSTQ